MTFKELAVGDRFEFDSTEEWNVLGQAAQKGPWRKVSARRYEHATTRWGIPFQVRTIHTPVAKETER